MFKLWPGMLIKLIHSHWKSICRLSDRHLVGFAAVYPKKEEEMRLKVNEKM